MRTLPMRPLLGGRPPPKHPLAEGQNPIAMLLPGPRRTDARCYLAGEQTGANLLGVGVQHAALPVQVALLPCGHTRQWDVGGGGKAVTPTSPTAAFTPPLYGARAGPHGLQPPMYGIHPQTTDPQGLQTLMNHSPPPHPTVGLPPPKLCHWHHSPPLGTEGHSYPSHYLPQSNTPPPACRTPALTRQLLVGPGGWPADPRLLFPPCFEHRAGSWWWWVPPGPWGLFGWRRRRGGGSPRGLSGAGGRWCSGRFGGGFRGRFEPLRLGEAGDLLQVHHRHEQAGEKRGGQRGGRAAPGGVWVRGGGTATPSSAHQRLLSFCAFSGSG